MLKSMMRVVITAVGIAIGPGLVMLVYQLIRSIAGIDPNQELMPIMNLIIFIVSGLIFGLIFFSSSNKILGWFESSFRTMEEKLAGLPGRVVMSGFIGLILGLVIAFLISFIINAIPIVWLAVPLNILVYVFFGYMGVRIGMRALQDNFKLAIKDRTLTVEKEKPIRKPKKQWNSPKILDTSVIIDGRIFDVCKSGVIEGTIIIPEFVLGELRHIADSSDALKRGKGRRGLDILNKIQKELDIPVVITDRDYDDMEVDAKLLKLAKEVEGKVITNDFNLNKVAAVQGVPIININDLSNAVKPVLLPGEELAVMIIKEGKENGQGVAYLEDGTMIVVENARNKIGNMVGIMVTSVLQTSAGRMIFAKIAG